MRYNYYSLIFLMFFLTPLKCYWHGSPFITRCIGSTAGLFLFSVFGLGIEEVGIIDKRLLPVFVHIFVNFGNMQ